MPYVNEPDTLPDDPRTADLARRLGLPIPHVVGLVTCVYLGCIRHSPCGSTTEAEVHRHSRYRGRHDFTAAFIEAGFGTRVEDGIEISEWDQLTQGYRRVVTERQRLANKRAKAKGFVGVPLATPSPTVGVDGRSDGRTGRSDGRTSAPPPPSWAAGVAPEKTEEDKFEEFVRSSLPSLTPSGAKGMLERSERFRLPLSPELRAKVEAIAAHGPMNGSAVEASR